MKSLIPCNIDAEKAVLGSMMLNEESVLIAINDLSFDDFYKKEHEEIFGVIQSLFIAGRNVDLITVAEELSTIGKLQFIGNASYLSSLTDIIAGSRLTKQHCEIIKEKSKQRKIVNLSMQIIDRCNSNEHVKQTIDFFGKEFFNITADKTSKIRSAKDIAIDAMKQIENDHEFGPSMGITTGFTDLDKRWNGLCKSEFIVIAARPSMGKTALAANIGFNTAIAGNRVMIFSLEMSDTSLIQREIANISMINSDLIKKAMLSDQQLEVARVACSKIGSLPLFIDDTPGLSIVELSARAKMYKVKVDFDLIIIDYMGLMSAKAENRTQEVSAISRGIKNLAKEMDIPVIGLSQLNRDVEKRVDKRPVLSDLRESGAIEQDADIIAFVYRDEYYDKSELNPNRGISEIITAKHRNGPTGIDRLLFRGELSRFDNLAQ
jgi:replicative DNA helicase